MTNRQSLSRWISISCAALLSGCMMVGPDYQRPELDVPEQYVEPAATEPSIANLPWWQLFTDQKLVALIEEALSNNQNLGIAVSRIEEAAANLGITRANQFPFIDAGVSGGRLRESEDLLPGSSSRSDYSLAAAASFEVDLWGKLRRATKGLEPICWQLKLPLETSQSR